MTAQIRGFPEKFPVRSSGGRSFRYRISKLIAKIIFNAVWFRRLKIIGLENLSNDGPNLLVCNHLSMLDPLLVGAFCPLTLFTIAKKELYKFPPLAWWLAGLNTFPVDRQIADRRAIRKSLSILDNNGNLLIFMEGTRSTSQAMQKAEPGVGFLLARSRANVVPCAVWGSEKGIKGKLNLCFGSSISWSEFDVTVPPQKISDHLAAKVAALLPEGYRGVYGDPTQRLRGQED